MNSRVLICVSGLLASLPCVARAAKAVSDVQPPQKRQASVNTAERLATRKVPPAIPADFPSPFNPVGFDKPDPAEKPPAQGAPISAPVTQVVSPPGDRETLEMLAAQILPSGMIERNTTRRLTIGGKFFEVGTRFVAMYNNQEYELELVGIDRTTFTLRYRGEEITRPINKVK